jgi:hypothetical protein
MTFIFDSLAVFGGLILAYDLIRYYVRDLTRRK